jgi:hypothetical protein
MDSVQSINPAGSGYQVNDVLLIGGSGATVTVTSVNGSGGITGATLTTLGQWTATTYSGNNGGSVYIAGGHGTGAQITIASSTAANCGGGPRVLRDNLFYGITDPLTPSWNGSKITLFCYSLCQGNPGNSNDKQWTIRSNNLMYAFRTGSGQCTHPNEICKDPLLTNEPPTTVVHESDYDVFNPTVAGNSFLLTSESPAKGTGIPVSGLTTDYHGTTRPNPPAIGALEYDTAFLVNGDRKYVFQSRFIGLGGIGQRGLIVSIVLAVTGAVLLTWVVVLVTGNHKTSL